MDEETKKHLRELYGSISITKSVLDILFKEINTLKEQIDKLI